jgi:hypothetical protein
VEDHFVAERIELARDVALAGSRRAVRAAPRIAELVGGDRLDCLALVRLASVGRLLRVVALGREELSASLAGRLQEVLGALPVAMISEVEACLDRGDDIEDGRRHAGFQLGARDGLLDAVDSLVSRPGVRLVERLLEQRSGLRQARVALAIVLLLRPLGPGLERIGAVLGGRLLLGAHAFELGVAVLAKRRVRTHFARCDAEEQEETGD